LPKQFSDTKINIFGGRPGNYFSSVADEAAPGTCPPATHKNTNGWHKIQSLML